MTEPTNEDNKYSEESLPPEERTEILSEEQILGDEQTLSDDEPSLSDQHSDPIDDTIDEHSDTIFDDDKEKSFLADINFDVVDAGRWLLKVIGGPNNGAEFSMHPASVYVIGTDPNSCDIIFHDTSVSRQHARIAVSADDAMTIEDLKSRNGTLVDGETVKSKTKLSPNAIVTIGTTAFTVYDREGEMQTIISPLLPAIVKTLQNEEVKPIEPQPVAVESAPIAATPIPKESEELKVPEKTAHNLGAFIVIGILTSLLAIIGIGTATLFRSEPIQKQQEVDATELVQKALEPYPSIRPFFNKSTGVLQLTGDVLTLADKNQILYSLQGLNFIREIDSNGIIIDEYAWQEINQALSKNPTWKGITVYASAPGKFILTGYLQTRRQAAQLSEYLAANFMYLDRLEKRVVVEEDLINSVTTTLQSAGLKDVSVQVANNGEVTLSGSVPASKQPQLAAMLEEIRKIEGIRGLRNYVAQQAPEEAIINISDKYSVTGSSRQGSSYSVVIQGHILTVNDELDGMIIKEIKANSILLERDGVQYRIDINR